MASGGSADGGAGAGAGGDGDGDGDERMPTAPVPIPGTGPSGWVGVSQTGRSWSARATQQGKEVKLGGVPMASATPEQVR